MSSVAWEFVDDSENSNQDLFQVQCLNQPFSGAALVDLPKDSVKDTKRLRISFGHWASTGTFLPQLWKESLCTILRVWYHRNQQDFERERKELILNTVNLAFGFQEKSQWDHSVQRPEMEKNRLLPTGFLQTKNKRSDLKIRRRMCRTELLKESFYYERLLDVERTGQWFGKCSGQLHAVLFIFSSYLI